MGYLDHLRAYAPPDNKLDRNRNLARLSPISAYVSGMIGKADQWSDQVTHNLKNDRLRVAVKKTLQIGTRVLAVAGTAGFAVACTMSPVENPQDTPSEDTHSPNPSLIPDIHPTITPSLTQDSIHNPILSATPESIRTFEPQICGFDPKEVLFQESFIPHKTVTVLSEKGFKSAFGENYDANKAQIADQIGFELSEIAKDPEGVNRVIIPQTGLGADEIIDKAKLFTEGRELPFQVVEYYGEEMDLNGGSKVVIAVNAGSSGWTTSKWKDAHLVRRQDGGMAISGTFLELVEDENGNSDLIPIPGQRLYGGEPDIAQVDGCLPSVVQRDNQGKVLAVLKPEVNLNLPSEQVWIAASEQEKVAQQAVVDAIPTEAPINIDSLDHIPTGEMGCLDDRLCRVKVADGMGREAMQKFYQALAVGPQYQKNWKQLGWNVPANDTGGEKLEEYLKQSTGPEGQPYWIPLPDFSFPQGRGSGLDFRPDENIQNAGGISVDKVPLITFCLEDWEDQGVVGKSLHNIFDGQDRHYPPYTIADGPAKYPYSVAGYMPYKDRFVFVVGVEDDLSNINPGYADLNGLCDGDGNPTNAEKTEAYYETLLRLISEWPVDRIGFLDFTHLDNYIGLAEPGPHPPIIEVREIDAKIFADN